MNLSGTVYNTAQYGGGIYFDSTATIDITGGTISKNEAVNGGGIYDNSTGTENSVKGCVITGNKASSGGGGINHNGNGTLSIGGSNDSDSVTISDNTAGNEGGGICHLKDANGSVLTISGGKGLRKNALVKINGSYYLITDESGTSVTLNTAPAGTVSTVYVALAGIVDNTTSEKASEDAVKGEDGYYTSFVNDDGDKMPLEHSLDGICDVVSLKLVCNAVLGKKDLSAYI